MRRSRTEELRVGGLPLAVKFSLLMSLALALVMAGAGFFLASSVSRIVADSRADVLARSAQLSAHLGASLDEIQTGLRVTVQDEIERLLDPELHRDIDAQHVRVLRNAATSAARDAVNRRMREYRERRPWELESETGKAFEGGRLKRFDVRFTEGATRGQRGQLYLWDEQPRLLVPASGSIETARGLFNLIIAVVVLVMFVGAAVAYLIATQVSKPLVTMVDDVRQISRGNLAHRTRVKSGGEVALLARSIDRMAESLSEAQDAELQLSMRERELEVAKEVREALLPQAAPVVPGYELSDLHMDSPDSEGDFYDYIQVEDGRTGLLVCHVNGKGVPGALVGATARAYLRSELEGGGELVEAFKRANRELARDVRRGMYVTAIYALLDPAAGELAVVCAGHKIPLVRYVAAEKKVRLVQPEGIALAFDRGPVFDRSISVQRVPLGAGDRVVLANEGPARVVDASGAELGEKEFYRSVLRAAPHPFTEMATRVQIDLEEHAGEVEFPTDVAVMFLHRLA